MSPERSFQASAWRVHDTSTTMHDMNSPYIPPPPQRLAHLEVMDTDHPFVYRGADWDYPMRVMTDPDGMSMDSQERGSSSRGSSEPGGGGVRAGRGKGSKEKKKTGMACHFCRCEFFLDFFLFCGRLS